MKIILVIFFEYSKLKFSFRFYVKVNFFSEQESQYSGSVYDPFDPFDYMYSTTETVNSDPVYAAVEKSAKSPAVSPAAPPLPPRNSSAWNTIERRKTSLERRVCLEIEKSSNLNENYRMNLNHYLFQKKRQTRLYENVTVIKTRASLNDCDLKAFHKMVKAVRGLY